VKTDVLYDGENIRMLRHCILPASIDLVYLDPGRSIRRYRAVGPVRDT